MPSVPTSPGPSSSPGPLAESAIARGGLEFSLLALGRELETVVKISAAQKPIAWFPVAISHISTHAVGRTWAGNDYNHLYIVQLEGEAVEASRNESVEN